jgi:sugar phosphate isomerase/epimerase
MVSSKTTGPATGISAWCFPGGAENRADVVSIVGRTRELGLDGVELTMSDTGSLTLSTSRSECQALASACAAAGVAVWSLCTNLHWTVSLASPRQAERQRAVEIVLAMLERAAWLKAGAVTVIPGWLRSPCNPRAEAAPYGEALELARTSLRGCVRLAEKLRVKLALANAWNGLPASPVEMAGLVDSLRSRRAVACLDTGAALLTGGAGSWVVELGRRLALVRATDARTRFWADAGRARPFRDLPGAAGLGSMTALCEPGRGEVAWPALMDGLRRARFRGPITATCQVALPGLPERAAAFAAGLVGKPPPQAT